MFRPGGQLAHYEILAALGKGGMGEVWRARDTKLGREVAIKTLPEEFTRDLDRLARFEREAKLLASLNHPNIAAIYGLEEHDGIRFLVLELVDGPTLADRIGRGPIPVDELIPIAVQSAEALEAAHERGVIHRDLKPANIKVTEDGAAQVLDFGLAKAIETGPPHGSGSDSPTLSMAATSGGMILGTAAYMSPEQAKGRPVDRRTDVFAFGSVLYECLTGKRAFEGETPVETLGAILHQAPDLAAVPASTPPDVRWLLVRCLEKETLPCFTPRENCNTGNRRRPPTMAVIIHWFEERADSGGDSKNRRALYHPQRARAAAVLCSAEAYEHSQNQHELLRLLAAGEKEIAVGQGHSLDSVLWDSDRLLSKA